MKRDPAGTRLEQGQAERAAQIVRVELERSAEALARGETGRALSAARRAGGWMALLARSRAPAGGGAGAGPEPDWRDLARRMGRLQQRAEARRAAVAARLGVERAQGRLAGAFAAATPTGGSRLDREG